MVRFFHAHFLPISRRGSATELAFVLCCGFLFGSLLATVGNPFGSSALHCAMMSRAATVSLVVVSILPLAFTAFAILVECSWIVIPVAFCKAISFSYLGASVLCTHEMSGWLLRFLFLFSDSLALPVLCLVWTWVLERRAFYRSLLVASLFIFAIVIFDCQFVSPLLVSLLS